MTEIPHPVGLNIDALWILSYVYLGKRAEKLHNNIYLSLCQFYTNQLVDKTNAERELSSRSRQREQNCKP